MSANPLVELLSRLVRDQAFGPDRWELDVVHRGAPDDTRLVVGEDVVRVSGRGIELRDGTELPLHRIKHLRGDGETLWRRRVGDAD